MKEGRIVQSGKYDDLIADKDGELSKQMDAHNKSLSQVTPAQVHSLARNRKYKKKQKELTEIEPDHNVLGRESEEERESGRVKWGIYRKFVTSAYRGALIPVILACQVLFQTLQICSNYWIAWASESQEQVSREKMIGIFVLLSAGSSAFILGRAFVLSAIAIETAQQLFLGMIKNIFRAPINFFDSTPSSRILNRVSTSILPLGCNIITKTLLQLVLTVQPFCFSGFNRSKHTRHGHSLQASRANICTNSAPQYHFHYVPNRLAHILSIHNNNNYIHLLSGTSSHIVDIF